jgi:hypothetical protein
VVACRDRNTATQSSRPKKDETPLGCLELHRINTNALWLFAHFFRRLPTGIYLKNTILQWQSSKKIERLMKPYPPKPVINLMFRLFCFGLLVKIKMLFFQLKEKISKLN